MRRHRSESTLQGISLHVASRNAPAEAEKTERLSGASRPSAKVMTSANKSRSRPLRKAAARVNTPRTRAAPSKVSAQVDTQARAGIVADGMNQLSFAVYAMKCEKSPQATPRFPNAPQKPNRSPTAERKDNPRASRKNTELKFSSRLNKPSPPSLPPLLRDLGVAQRQVFAEAGHRFRSRSVDRSVSLRCAG